jgi:polar amino acid transport system substrate-binding protein
MKKLLVFICIICSMDGFAQTKELNLISDVWPPFTNVETEDSFAIDLVREALDRINIESTIEISSFENLLSTLDSGKYDGSAALWINDEREKDYNFSKPYLQNQLVLVGHKGIDVSAGSFSELKDKRIGVIENYAYGEKLYTNKDIIIVNGKSNQHNLEKLLTDKIDYMLVDALLIQYMLKYQVNDVTAYLEIGSKPLLIKSLHFVLRKDIKDSDEIISHFNEEIQKMIADGTYHNILKLNWISADIDGDGNMEFVLRGNEAGLKAPINSYGVSTETAGIMQIKRPDKYYINGVMYHGWENVPTNYKIEDNSPKYPSLNDQLLRFKF